MSILCWNWRQIYRNKEIKEEIMAVPFWGFSAPKLNIAQSVTQDLSDILQYLQFTPNWNVICTVTIILLNILMKSITTRRNQ